MTYWFDLHFVSVPLDADSVPGMQMCVLAKGQPTDDGRLRIGFTALSAQELEGNVQALKDQLDQIVAEAKRAQGSYIRGLSRKVEARRQAESR